MMSHFSGVQTMIWVAVICSLVSWVSPVSSDTVIPYELSLWEEENSIGKVKPWKTCCRKLWSANLNFFRLQSKNINKFSQQVTNPEKSMRAPAIWTAGLRMYSTLVGETMPVVKSSYLESLALEPQTLDSNGQWKLDSETEDGQLHSERWCLLLYWYPAHIPFKRLFTTYTNLKHVTKESQSLTMKVGMSSDLEFIIRGNELRSLNTMSTSFLGYYNTTIMTKLIEEFFVPHDVEFGNSPFWSCRPFLVPETSWEQCRWF